MESRIEEGIIRGGPNDFMEAHHLVLQCSNREAGRALASIAKARQYITAKPARTLWHAFYDLDDLAVEIDFYLGDEPGGSIRRSAPQRFVLGREGR